jgi:hypothetical protein
MSVAGHDLARLDVVLLRKLGINRREVGLGLAEQVVEAVDQEVVLPVIVDTVGGAPMWRGCELSRLCIDGRNHARVSSGPLRSAVAAKSPAQHLSPGPQDKEGAQADAGDRRRGAVSAATATATAITATAITAAALAVSGIAV